MLITKGFPRDPITNPAGIFFRATGSIFPQLFNQHTLFVDMYIALNETIESMGLGCIIKGNIIVSDYLSLDNLDIEINLFNWSDHNPLWHRNGAPESEVIAFSRPKEMIVLNNMVEILPDRSVYAEPSILIYYLSDSAAVHYYSVRVRVFCINFDTIATIVGDNIYMSSPNAVTIFGSYPAYLWCQAFYRTAQFWEDLVFEVTGHFVSESSINVNSFISQITNEVWDGIMTISNVSKQRHINAIETLNYANELLTAKMLERNAAQIAYNASLDVLNEANSNVTSRRDALNNIRQQAAAFQPDISNMRMTLDHLCTPIQCPTTCLPVQNCATCTDTVVTRTFSECDTTCYEDLARSDDAGVNAVDCWEWNEVAFKQVEASCGWRSQDYIDYGCRSRSYNLTLLTSQQSSCTEPASDYPFVAERQPYNCSIPCESSPQLIDIEYICCSRNPCSIQLSQKDCLLFNHACSTYRYEVLVNGTHGMRGDAVTILRMEEKAEQDYNRALFAKLLAEHTVNWTRDMLNILDVEYRSTFAASLTAQNQLNNVTEEVINYVAVYGYLQSLPNNGFRSFDIINISFISYQNVTDQNSIIQLTIVYTISNESSSNVTAGVINGTYNFSNNNVKDLIVQDVMAMIVNSIVSQGHTVKRDVPRAKRQITPPNSNTVLKKFQNNCITLKNAEEMLQNLVASLSNLSSQFQSSYENLHNVINEVVMIQSNYSLSRDEGVMFINNETFTTLNNTEYLINSDAAQYLGINVATIQVNNSLDLTDAQGIIEQGLNQTRLSIENLGQRVFAEWAKQIRSIILGVQTGNCFSFGDCTILIVHEIQSIIASSPSDLVRLLPSTYEQISQEFLEVASNSNLTIIEAYNRSTAMANVITSLLNSSYWCATPPNITVQPRPFGLFTVGQYYFISCSGIGTPPLSYTWLKDDQLLSGATENTLIFPQLRLSDDGIYTCVATNMVHSARSMPAVVRVQSIPNIIAQPVDFDVQMCSVNGAVFQVNATGMPAPSYQWYFRHINATIYVPIEGATSSVHFIEKPQAQNKGHYYCNVSNSRGSVLSDEAQLNILEYEIAQLSAVISYTISRCNRSNQDYMFIFNFTEPVNYTVAFYTILVGFLRNYTNVDLFDQLNSESESDLSENGGRVVMDLVTAPPQDNGLDCINVISAAEYLTSISAQLNATLMTFQNNVATLNILLGINSVDYCIDSLVIQPDEPVCSGRGKREFAGILCGKSVRYCKAIADKINNILQTLIGGFVCVVDCPPGTYGNVENGVQICTKCPKGTYQSTEGQTQCINCPVNATTEISGATSFNQCYCKICV